MSHADVTDAAGSTSSLTAGTSETSVDYQHKRKTSFRSVHQQFRILLFSVEWRMRSWSRVQNAAAKFNKNKSVDLIDNSPYCNS